MKRIIVTDDIFKTAADRFADLARTAINARGRFDVARAGGTTPKSLYRMLASEPHRLKIDWAKVFFFFGDERFVPFNDPKSNFRMADESLFRPLGIAESQIFRWPTEEPNPASIAERYATSIASHFAAQSTDCPRFDLVLLGLGEDGHTASLFPETAALAEFTATTLACFVEKLGAWRFSLTFPLINRARTVIFLVSGEKKADVVRDVFDPDHSVSAIPARGVESDDLLFLIDRPAARLIDPEKLNENSAA